MFRFKNEKGLTLIELLITISVLAVVSAIALPVINNVVTSSNSNALNQTIKDAEAFIAKYSKSGVVVYDELTRTFTGYVDADGDNTIDYNEKIDTLTLDKKYAISATGSASVGGQYTNGGVTGATVTLSSTSNSASGTDTGTASGTDTGTGAGTDTGTGGETSGPGSDTTGGETSGPGSDTTGGSTSGSTSGFTTYVAGASNSFSWSWKNGGPYFAGGARSLQIIDASQAFGDALMSKNVGDTITLDGVNYTLADVNGGSKGFLQIDIAWPNGSYRYGMIFLIGPDWGDNGYINQIGF